MSNTNLTIFNNDKFGDMRAYLDDSGEPWFCGNDVAKALGYSNTRDAISKHCKNKGVAKRDVGVVTGKKLDGTDAIQNISMIYINESNLYRLVFGSKLESAEQFQDWVTEEVLPTLRKTGSYSLTKSNMDIAIYSEDPLERGEAIVAMLKEERAKQLLLIQQKEQAEQTVQTVVPGSKDILWSKWCNDVCHITTPLVHFVLVKNNVYNKHKLIAKEYADCFKETPTEEGYIRRYITPKGQQIILKLLQPYMLQELLVDGKYVYKKRILTNLGLI